MFIKYGETQHKIFTCRRSLVSLEMVGVVKLLKMVPFDNHINTTFYWPTIVNI